MTGSCWTGVSPTTYSVSTPGWSTNLAYHSADLCSRFRYGQISDWMGGPSRSAYITMIRDPADLFVSAWDYYQLGPRYYQNMSLGKTRTVYSRPQSSLDQFVSSPESVTRRRPDQTMGPNQLLWDLGLDDVYNEGAVRETIELMDRTFHLVMILHKFEVPNY